VKRGYKQFVGVVVLLAVTAGVSYIVARMAVMQTGTRETPSAQAIPVVAAEPQPAFAPVRSEAPGSPVKPVATTPVAPPSPFDSASAQGALRRGMELLAAQKLIEARGELSAAIFSGALDEAQAQQARNALEDLADMTIFSSRILEGDPYAIQYTVEQGEILDKLERRLQLRVPSPILLKINGIPSASSIRAGQTLKLIQGPFHAVVSKSGFTMDIFLHRPGLEKVYIKRLRVGLGKNGSTPVGSWKVGLGRKMKNAIWYPPPTSGMTLALRPGDKDYPLGTAGYWIGLIGTDPNTSGFAGYGIHGTNNLASIGKAESLGCIRLADADIDLVFSLLYEEWSTVRVEL
jgi:hypothetical protein